MDNRGIYQIPTEAPNPRTRDIDLLPSAAVVSLRNSEDQKLPLAVASRRQCRGDGVAPQAAQVTTGSLGQEERRRSV